MSEPELVLAWEQLRDWTAWLVARYRLVLEDRLPTCWPQHPELIEELWALRAWRSEAYGPEGTGQSAVYWHQAFVTFLGHVSNWWAGGCRAGHANSDTDLSAEQIRSWASVDPLSAVPQPMRPISSELNVVTTAQMRALTNAGLAHPYHESVAAFTYYDGSWWAFGDGMWFRADDVDLASDRTLILQPSARK